MNDNAREWDSNDTEPTLDAPWWQVDRAQIWSWVEDDITASPIPAIGASVVQGLCALALETYAPAVVVNAQAAGVDLGRLVFAAINERYRDRFGRPHRGKYEVARLRLVIQTLRLRVDRPGQRPSPRR
jgi:hypothetical protein